MALNKDDLNQIEKIVDKRAALSEKRLYQKMEQEINKAREETSDLAAMSAREFEVVHQEINNLHKSQVSHDFKMAEMGSQG